MRAVRDANRSTLFHHIAAHIGHVQNTGIPARVAHSAHNIAGNITIVEVHGPVLRKIPQRLCIIGIAQNFALFQRFAQRIEIGSRTPKAHQAI